MSDSRLEKFIYAICSMDVSDLPVPLSRIEKLWNCLITGETPDFEPLSRNEKYLMAMLDRYDISNLPAPMSRGEKLLYKIAVGETDLSDVPGYLSRYEELLKYLIENGGISGGDFEYVLYTLNQSLSTLYLTAEKPVKSAILKGQTLVNVANGGESIPLLDGNRSNSIATLYPLKTNTKMLIKFNSDVALSSGFCTLYFTDVNGKNIFSKNSNIINGNNSFIFTTPLEDVVYNFKIYTNLTGIADSALISNLQIFEYQDGMENWDIPYFEGMQSVKMPVLKTVGKNLFDINHFSKLENWDGKTTSERPYCAYEMKLKPNTSYTFSRKENSTANNIYFCISKKQGVYEWSGGIIHPTDASATQQQRTITTDSTGILYFNLYQARSELANLIPLLEDTQLEEGSVATSYEPHKSNILTTPEDLELRGIGDVRDTLDCLTGEVTERIGKVVLNGSENWSIWIADDSFVVFTLPKSFIDFGSYENVICAKYPIKNTVYSEKKECIGINNDKSLHLQIRLLKTKATTTTEFKTWLSQNPITLQYPLATEFIKTIDISTVDQDNQPTELGTFENVTHVSLVAENLIPEVEMEVATKLLEDTVFNLTNAFNTLYPTAAKPVKSAILKGNTMKNIIGDEIFMDAGTSSITNITDLRKNYLIPTVKISTNYLVMYELEGDKIEGADASNLVTAIGFLNHNSGWSSNFEQQPLKGKLIINSGDYPNYFRVVLNNKGYSKLKSVKINVIEYEEYMNDFDIPYFEGMQSVKMPVLTTRQSANLFNKNNVSSISELDYLGDDFIDCNYGEKYSISLPQDGVYWSSLWFYDENKELIYSNIGDSTSSSKTIYVPSVDCKFLKLKTMKSCVDTIMLTRGEPLPYEHYSDKTNILTVNEDVTLRGIGDVQDKLDCLTGEVTESIGEIVLDGTQYMVSDGYGVYIQVNDVKRFLDYTDKIACDKLPVIPTYRELENVENGISGFTNSGSYLGQNWLYVKINNSVNTDEVKEWLTQKPITVQYQLAQESIKTVDLTIINQDGNETKLGTFDDTTHVLLESEGLIPTASLTVRTKIPSGSSTSLLMDDISTNQQQLETTVDEQSNNVDATMIATTEIFEETL